MQSFLLLCAIVSTVIVAEPVDQPNAQRAEISLQTSRSLGLCNDSRCSCSHSSHGLANVNCQCSPQDQVLKRPWHAVHNRLPF